MAWPPTTEQILDVVEGGVYHRADRYGFELLDPAWDVIGDLAVSPDSAPTLSIDTSRSIIRTVDNLDLPHHVLNDVNPVTDLVRPVMHLQNGERFHLGILGWAQDNRPLRSWGPEHASSLRDNMFVLNQPRGRTSSTRKGQNLLQRAIDHAALRVPRERMRVEGSSGAVAAAPMVWPPNEPLTNVVNGHLAPIGYLPAHFDHEGLLVFRPAPVDVDVVEPDVIYRPGGRILADSIVGSDDLLDAPNVYVVMESSGQGPPIIGRYQIPASAPHSVENRNGQEIIRVIPMQGLESTAQANAAAKLAAQTEDATFEWQQYSGVADPRHDTWTMVQLLAVNYLEVSHRMVLVSGGPHTHVVRRVY